MTLISIKQIQELRGQLEHWSVCNMELATEMRYIDKMLVARSGVISPPGPLSGLKKEYMDFRDSLETIRARLLTDGSMSQSYTSSYSRVLSPDELLSFPDIQTSIIWLGPDATPTQCDASDFTNRRFAVCPYSFCVAFISHVADLPEGDFLLIALGECLSIL